MKRPILALLLLLFGGPASRCFGDFITVTAVTSTMTYTVDPLLTKDLINTDLDPIIFGFEHEETYSSNAWIGEITSVTDLVTGITTHNNSLIYNFLDSSGVESISIWNLTGVSDVFSNASSPHYNPSLDTAVWNPSSGLKYIKLYGLTGSTWMDLSSFSTQDDTLGRFQLDSTVASDTYNDPFYGDLFFAREQRFQLSTPLLFDQVKVEVVSNFRGDNIVGFGAINFFSPASAAVPEPTSLALFGGSIILAGAYRRFCRRR